MLDAQDHRSLGQRQELFHWMEEAPGSVFWQPRGWALYRALEEALRALLREHRYQEVRSPQVLGRDVWERSGHWRNFRHDMLLLEEVSAGACALKPVSCPGHLLLAGRGVRSHRELPLRLAEFGLCHRNEPSGALHGLFRLRQFSQDDGHIFCLESQVVEEVQRFCASVRGFYARCGFDAVEVAFSSRPAQREGSEAAWDRAEALLLEAARAAGLDPVRQEGQGAFYGPKLEFALRDRVGRAWQCGTLQLDLVLPERFGVSFAGSGGEPLRPVMLHRAVVGSLERFIGLLLEHHRGVLPAWLAPEQVRVLAVGEVAEPYASSVASESLARLRANVDARDVSLSRRIAEAHDLGIPFVVIVGPREVASQRAVLRDRQGGQRELSRAELAEVLERECSADPRPADAPSFGVCCRP